MQFLFFVSLFFIVLLCTNGFLDQLPIGVSGSNKNTSQLCAINNSCTLMGNATNNSRTLMENRSQDKLGPIDITVNNRETGGTPEVVAKELSMRPGSEIINFPINSLNTEDLIKILNSLLSPDDLYKVLLNLDTESLRVLLNEKLPEEKVSEILDRMRSPDKTEIINRLF
jgi:hypothetical protein